MVHYFTTFRNAVVGSNFDLGHIQKILSFADLSDGWHYGSGKNISRGSIEMALRIASDFSTAGADAIEAFPNVTGGVLVSGYSSGETVDVLCQVSGALDLFHEKAEKEIADEHNLSYADVAAYIRVLPWRSLKLSDSCIHFSTVTSFQGSRAKQLSPPMTVFLSSTQHVEWPRPEQFADIYGISTPPESQETQQYFSDLKLENYQPKRA